MIPKIAFIGAGSFQFTRKLVRDILTFPALANCHISLMDIDQERLAYIKQGVDKIVSAGNYPAKITATLDRAEALRGAAGVVCAILQGGVDVFRHDVEIPRKYGVDINVGDTRGPAGVFRALRTIPVMLDICRDAERYCPQAVVLNYTNPMSMLCRAMQEQSSISVIGLCHSVQGLATGLACKIGVPYEEITSRCAGINHQAWLIDFKWKGKDVYPLLREAYEKNPELYRDDKVRAEMFLHLGYYVTETSGHNSEYNPWFRKRPDLIEKYCLSDAWNTGKYAFIRDEYLKAEKTWRQDIKKGLTEPVDLNLGFEYAAFIFNAVFGDGALCEFNGNVRNFGLIDNLPHGGCVEIPILASRRGFDPIHIGPLPPQLAILNGINVACDELAVAGSLSGDPELICQSVYFDPLTSAVLSLSEIKQMVGEMFLANRAWLPQFKHFT